MIWWILGVLGLGLLIVGVQLWWAMWDERS